MHLHALRLASLVLLAASASSACAVTSDSSSTPTEENVDQAALADTVGSAIKGLGGKCLSTNGYTFANGTPLILWDCLGQDNQKWSLYSDRTIRGFGGKCISTNGVSTANGTGLILWDCLGQANQRWEPSDSLKWDTSRTGFLSTVGGKKCFSASNASSDNGTSVVLWDCLGQSSQVWEPYASAGLTPPPLMPPLTPTPPPTPAPTLPPMPGPLNEMPPLSMYVPRLDLNQGGTYTGTFEIECDTRNFGGADCGPILRAAQVSFQQWNLPAGVSVSITPPTTFPSGQVAQVYWQMTYSASATMPPAYDGWLQWTVTSGTWANWWVNPLQVYLMVHDGSAALAPQ
jgi:hypothetical protein